jgi:hypothetical protein
VLLAGVVARRLDDRVHPASWDGATENIYIVNADGTGLFQVTDGGYDENADWGVPPDGS